MMGKDDKMMLNLIHLSGKEVENKVQFIFSYLQNFFRPESPILLF